MWVCVSSTVLTWVEIRILGLVYELSCRPSLFKDDTPHTRVVPHPSMDSVGCAEAEEQEEADLCHGCCETKSPNESLWCIPLAYMRAIRFRRHPCSIQTPNPKYLEMLRLAADELPVEYLNEGTETFVFTRCHDSGRAPVSTARRNLRVVL